MARRDAARYAAMSDPARNRWFSCPWDLPPPERKTPGAPTPGAILKGKSSSTIGNANQAKAQAIAEAERLFAKVGAA